jgi:cytochrome P450
MWPKIPYTKASIRGQAHIYFDTLHRKYGPVVRAAPNTLSFITPKAYTDTHNNNNSKNTVFVKNDFYDGIASWNRGNKPVRNLVNEIDPQIHAGLKALLAPAFSKAALKKQEASVMSSVKLFLDHMGRSAGQMVDIKSWYNRLMFDLIAELAFGRPFGVLKTGEKRDINRIVFFFSQLIKRR